MRQHVEGIVEYCTWPVWSLHQPRETARVTKNLALLAPKAGPFGHHLPCRPWPWRGSKCATNRSTKVDTLQHIAGTTGWLHYRLWMSGSSTISKHASRASLLELAPTVWNKSCGTSRLQSATTALHHRPWSVIRCRMGLRDSLAPLMLDICTVSTSVPRSYAKRSKTWYNN